MTGFSDAAEAVARVEAFVAALEHHGHGKSIVSCRHGHEAHWPGPDQEYVSLRTGDLRDLLDRLKQLEREREGDTRAVHKLVQARPGWQEGRALNHLCGRFAARIAELPRDQTGGGA